MSLTVDSLIATRCTWLSPMLPSPSEPRWSIVLTYNARLRSQMTAVPSSDPLTANDHIRHAATDRTRAEWARKIWLCEREV